MFGNEFATKAVGANVSGNEAILIVYTPKLIPTQVVRPYQYAFTDKVIEGFVELDDKNKRGITTSFEECERLHGAILPDSVGIKVHNELLSNYWTFVLILTTNDSAFNSQIFGRKNKTIGTGYFIDEPFDINSLFTSNPIMNPNAIMKFTHATSLAIGVGNNLNAAGMVSGGGYINMDGDNVGQYIDQHSSEQMFAMTPGDLKQAMSHSHNNIFPGQLAEEEVGNADLVCTPGAAALGQMHETTMIASTQKSPKHHLLEIGKAVTKGLDVLDDNNTILSALSDFDMTQSANSIISKNLEHRRGVTIQSATDPTNRCRTDVTMSQFAKAFPTATIQPIELNYTSQWDVKPQDIMTQATVMGSIIAPTIQSLAIGVGLSSVSFGYCSYNTSVLDTKGVWKIIEDPHIFQCGEDREAVKKAMVRFMGLMEHDLFPILKSIGGEFEMVIRYDMVGETLVDFRYLDTHSESGGFLETPNRFSSFVTPNVGNIRTFTNNASNLQHLYSYVDSVQMANHGMDEAYPGMDPMGHAMYQLSHGPNGSENIVIPM